MDWNELLKIVLDKGLLAILLAIIGLWINRKLSEYKSDLEHNIQTKILIAESRLPAFTSLWDKTAATSPTREKSLGDVERKQLNSSLREWYYENGNGLFLTGELRDLYLNARKSLEKSSSEPESEKEITDLFTKLRTELKNEIGIYGHFK